MARATTQQSGALCGEIVCGPPPTCSAMGTERTNRGCSCAIWVDRPSDSGYDARFPCAIGFRVFKNKIHHGMRTFKKCVTVEFHRVNGDALSRASCSCRRRCMCRCNPSDFQRKRRRPLRSWTIQPTGCKRRASQRSASMRHWAIVEFIRAKRILLQALSEGRVVDGATFVIGAHRLRFFATNQG